MHLATVALSHRYLLLGQYEALLADGHEVVAVSAPGEDVEELERRGIRHRSLDGSTRGFDLRADLRAIRSFARIVRDERPDVVHTHNPKPGVYGRIVARLAGVPVVVNTVHGLYATPDDSLIRRTMVYGLEAVSSRFSHLELVQNIEDVELMRRTLIAPSAKVRHLGNGIDVRRFDPDRALERRRSVRAELGIDDGELVVGSVGRMVAEKGFPELFEASARLRDPHTLVVVGPSDSSKPDALPSSMLEAARDRGVRILGHRTDVERLLPAFDLFVLASHREGVPRAAMEAAAAGLPVVATNIRGCRQVVDDGEDGLLVPVADPAALAEAITVLTRDGELRRRMGKAARMRAEADFDERLVIERLRASYREVGVEAATLQNERAAS